MDRAFAIASGWILKAATLGALVFFSLLILASGTVETRLLCWVCVGVLWFFVLPFVRSVWR